LKSWSGGSMGIPAGLKVYIRLIIYVLVAAEKQKWI
jgi:hypothetical protein